jgi:hypothetical protein
MRRGAGASVVIGVLLAATPSDAGPLPCATAAFDDAPPATTWVRDPSLEPAAWLAPCDAAFATAPRSHQRLAEHATAREQLAAARWLIPRVVAQAKKLRTLADQLADFEPATPRLATPPTPMPMPREVAMARRECAAYAAAQSSVTRLLALRSVELVVRSLELLNAEQHRLLGALTRPAIVG